MSTDTNGPAILYKWSDHEGDRGDFIEDGIYRTLSSAQSRADSLNKRKRVGFLQDERSRFDKAEKLRRQVWDQRLVNAYEHNVLVLAGVRQGEVVEIPVEEFVPGTYVEPEFPKWFKSHDAFAELVEFED